MSTLNSPKSVLIEKVLIISFDLLILMSRLPMISSLFNHRQYKRQMMCSFGMIRIRITDTELLGSYFF